MMKPERDIDKDSALGFSVFTGGKSTTLSEVSLFIPCNVHIHCIVSKKAAVQYFSTQYIITLVE